MPWEWLVSRVCEEFGCLPAEAVDALENDPEHLILDIMLLRGFARTKEAYDNAKRKIDLPQSPMLERLLEIEFEQVKASGKH